MIIIVVHFGRDFTYCEMVSLSFRLVQIARWFGLKSVRNNSELQHKLLGKY